LLQTITNLFSSDDQRFAIGKLTSTRWGHLQKKTCMVMQAFLKFTLHLNNLILW